MGLCRCGQHKHLKYHGTIFMITRTFNIDPKTRQTSYILTIYGALKGGEGSGAMFYVQNSLACYVLCKFLFTLLCEIKIGCYA